MRLSLLALALTSVAYGADSKPLLNDKPLPSLAAPSFKEPLDATWSQAKGKWTPDNGVLHMVEITEEKHVPVLWHKVGLSAAVIELDFKQDAAGVFYVGCDADKHVGRVVVLGGTVVIQEDTAKASHTIATQKYAAKAGEWHPCASNGKTTASLSKSTIRHPLPPSILTLPPPRSVAGLPAPRQPT